MNMKIWMVISCFSLILLNATNQVTGQTPYDSNRQICCNGTLQDSAGVAQPQCCGSGIYDGHTQQCCDDETTVIPLTTNGGNDTLTCCGGQGVVAGYNQMCCGGRLQEQPTVIAPSDTFGCCVDTPYIIQRQSCCNGVVSADAAQVLQCCNNNASYDSTKFICCENIVVTIPDTSTRYQYQCCGTEGYDTTIELCDDDTDTIYAKPANASCPDAYTQICGGKVLNPNEQCCNNDTFRPPSVWIDDGQGTGTGYMGVVAMCCPDGKGIVQDPSKETCCNNGEGGILPIDLPSQACCANQIIDIGVNTCCNETIVAGPSNGCCGDKATDYSTQICCGDQVYEQSDGYNSCCSPNIMYG